MGRGVRRIALHAGVAGDADVTLILEIPFQMAAVIEKIRERNRRGRNFSIVVVAEGATPVGGMALFGGEVTYQARPKRSQGSRQKSSNRTMPLMSRMGSRGLRRSTRGSETGR